MKAKARRQSEVATLPTKQITVTVVQAAPTIEMRLDRAMSRLALIVAAGSAIGMQAEMELNNFEIAEAISEAATEAHNELYWLKTLAADVLKIDAPDSDDLETAEDRLGGARNDFLS